MIKVQILMVQYFTSVSPLNCASLCGHTEIVSLLLHRGSHQQRDFTGFTPCIHAALQGHVEVLKLLLAHGGDVNGHCHGDERFPSVLAYACHNWNYSPECIQLLLEAGANPTKAFYDRETLSHYCGEDFRADVAQIKNGGIDEEDVLKLYRRMQCADLIMVRR